MARLVMVEPGRCTQMRWQSEKIAAYSRQVEMSLKESAPTMNYSSPCGYSSASARSVSIE